MLEHATFVRGVVFFFFFQAEDGIRDVAVTGVQTCALPIWSAAPRRGAARPPRPRRTRETPTPCARPAARRAGRTPARSGAPPSGRVARAARSEERRVGKECRSRWARYQ